MDVLLQNTVKTSNFDYIYSSVWIYHISKSLRAYAYPAIVLLALLLRVFIILLTTYYSKQLFSETTRPNGSEKTWAD